MKSRHFATFFIHSLTNCSHAGIYNEGLVGLHFSDWFRFFPKYFSCEKFPFSLFSTSFHKINFHLYQTVSQFTFKNELNLDSAHLIQTPSTKSAVQSTTVTSRFCWGVDVAVCVCVFVRVFDEAKEDAAWGAGVLVKAICRSHIPSLTFSLPILV